MRNRQAIDVRGNSIADHTTPRSVAFRNQTTMLCVGNNGKEPNEIYLGREKTKRIYLGEQLVWPINRTKVIVNYGSTLFRISHKDRLYAAGQASFGGLGLGEGLERVSVLTEVPGMDPVVDVQPVGTGTFALKADGTLWSVGTSNSGQLGYGTYGGVTDDLHTATRFEFWRVNPHNAPANVTMLSSGYTTHSRLSGSSNFANGFMLIVDGDGFIWGVGNNERGQFGNGTTVSNSSETRGFGRSLFSGDIKCIGRGMRHSVVVLNDHTLWSCGDNSVGQTGLPALETGNWSNACATLFTKTPLTNVAGVSCNDNTTMAVKRDGTLWACGDLSDYKCGLNPRISNSDGFVNEFTKVSLTNVKKAVLGHRHGIALTNDGRVFLAGKNYNGSLGYNNNNATQTTFQEVVFQEEVVDIAAGYDCSHVVFVNGDIWGTGYNTWGQLGVGNTDVAVYGFTKAA